MISAVSVRSDGWAQRGGIDRVIALACGRVFTVDEKVRTTDWNDILLEQWSDEGRRSKRYRGTKRERRPMSRFPTLVVSGYKRLVRRPSNRTGWCRPRAAWRGPVRERRANSQREGEAAVSDARREESRRP
jgi:hypothetical protein